MANRAVGRLVSGEAPAAVQRWKPPVTTPAFPPDRAPPGQFAPGNVRRDDEGNEVAVAGGRPYLVDRPPNLAFPHAGNGDHRLYPVNPNTAYRKLRARCQTLLIHQRALAEALRGDMKYWFARVYGYVTEYTLKDVNEGLYLYPHMKLQQVIHFHETYERNLRAWVEGKRTEVEANWVAAFTAADEGSWIG
ncbi:MAG: hypothetical protein WA991_01385, partial [Ornithinimicrobium sp.]